MVWEVLQMMLQLYEMDKIQGARKCATSSQENRSGALHVEVTKAVIRDIFNVR